MVQHIKKKPKIPKKKTFSKSLLLLFILGIFLTAGGYIYVDRKSQDNANPANTEPVVLNQQLNETTKKSGKLKQFTGEEFKNLYNSYSYPNTQYIAEDAVITGDAEADTMIRQLAEERGYVRRSAPVFNTFVEVEPGMLLQERASEPWVNLQKAAAKDNIQLFLTAAYRSAKEQREIFLSRAESINLTKELIKSGLYNAQLNEIFATTAIPGYSRHHTGYTIDIGCGNDPNTAFDFTVCFDWLSADNYKNTKLYGWVPSYPEGGGLQGPEPETWEYVWVGTDAVTE